MTDRLVTYQFLKFLIKKFNKSVIILTLSKKRNFL